MLKLIKIVLKFEFLNKWIFHYILIVPSLETVTGVIIAVPFSSVTKIILQFGGRSTFSPLAQVNFLLSSKTVLRFSIISGLQFPFMIM